MPSTQTFPDYQAASGWNALLPARKARTVAPMQTHFDAVVIGAGVTGLAAARRIAELEPHAHILLLDATQVGEGSAGRNSGFLINTPHNTSISGHNSPTDIARQQIALYNMGLQWLKSLVDQHHIDCGWNAVGKYHAATTPAGVKSLQHTICQYQHWGIRHHELDQTALEKCLGTRYYHYGYHAENNVFIQPASLVRGLADNLPANVFLWENAPVIALEPGSPHRVVLNRHRINSPRIVIANNGFARRLGLARDRVFTIYTYAALTPTLPDVQHSTLGDAPEWGVIPANRLGTTLRKTVDGRLLVRSAYSYETECPLTTIRNVLQTGYRNRYPHLRPHDLQYVWGGATALTRNGALYFGKLADGIYLSIGCNGAGMLKGSTFGKLLGEMACGYSSPELTQALGFKRPSWLPPEPVRRMVVLGAIQWQKHKAGREC